MDPLALAFYAVICAALGAAAPSIPRLPVRLAVGAIVGIAAAALLPSLKGMMGAY